MRRTASPAVKKIIACDKPFGASLFCLRAWSRRASKTCLSHWCMPRERSSPVRKCLQCLQRDSIAPAVSATEHVKKMMKIEPEFVAMKDEDWLFGFGFRRWLA